MHLFTHRQNVTSLVDPRVETAQTEAFPASERWTFHFSQTSTATPHSLTKTCLNARPQNFFERTMHVTFTVLSFVCVTFSGIQDFRHVVELALNHHGSEVKCLNCICNNDVSKDELRWGLTWRRGWNPLDCSCSAGPGNCRGRPGSTEAALPRFRWC